MILVMILALMSSIIIVARKSKRFGLKQYLMAALIAVLQTGIALLYMFNLEKPPMF